MNGAYRLYIKYRHGFKTLFKVGKVKTVACLEATIRQKLWLHKDFWISRKVCVWFSKMVTVKC